VSMMLAQWRTSEKSAERASPTERVGISDRPKKSSIPSIAQELRLGGKSGGSVRWKRPFRSAARPDGQGQKQDLWYLHFGGD
jgi:hypothetical protein